MFGYLLLTLCFISIVTAVHKNSNSKVLSLSLALGGTLLSLKAFDILLSPVGLILLESKDIRLARRFDAEVAKESFARAARHPWKFNDVWPIPNASQRIMVLGDSFVFGDGLRESDRWSRKLEVLVKEVDPTIQVSHCGRNGWSTFDEFQFLKEQNDYYPLQKVLVGFVENDPAISANFPYRKTTLISEILSPIDDLVPNLRHHLVSNFARIEQGDWERSLYTEENLIWYGGLLREMKKFAEAKNFDLHIILTPSACTDSIHKRFLKVQNLINEVGISSLNLLQILCRDIENIPPKSRVANAVNGHPGPGLTSLFAKEVFNYLKLKS